MLHANKTLKKNKTMTDEYAKVIKWAPRWSPGAPMPQVFGNGRKTYLIYYIADWEAKSITAFDRLEHADGHEEFLALVEFNGYTFRFGIANEEVFNGLPLWRKGLEECEAHIIENSTWIDELKKIHIVHRFYNEDRWKEVKHFTLLFHDEMFEVIATNYKIETYKTTFAALAAEVAKRMNKQ